MDVLITEALPSSESYRSLQFNVHPAKTMQFLNSLSENSLNCLKIHLPSEDYENTPFPFISKKFLLLCYKALKEGAQIILASEEEHLDLSIEDLKAELKRSTNVSIFGEFVESVIQICGFMEYELFSNCLWIKKPFFHKPNQAASGVIDLETIKEIRRQQREEKKESVDPEAKLVKSVINNPWDKLEPEAALLDEQQFVNINSSELENMKKSQRFLQGCGRSNQPCPNCSCGRSL